MDRPLHRLLLVTIASSEQYATGYSKLRLPQIAKICANGQKSTQIYLRQLVLDGILQSIPGPGKGGPLVYRIVEPRE